MNKIFIAFAVLICVCFTACSRNGTKEPEICEFNITVPEHADINADYYIDGNLYYVLTYYPYFEELNAEGKSDKAFSKEFNTVVMQYSVDSGEYKTLYTYDADRCITVESITYDSKNECVIWEDHMDPYNFRILSVSLPSLEQSVLFTSDDCDSDSFSIILNSIDGVLYWYDLVGDDEKGYSFDLNAFENGHFYKRMTGLYLASPFEKVRIKQKNYAYVYSVDGENRIVYVDSSGNKKEIEVTDKDISNIFVNERYAIWGNGYNCDYHINIYDLKKGAKSVIDQEYYFSYVLLGNKVIFGTQENLMEYDPKTKVYSTLLKGISPGFILMNEKGEVYFKEKRQYKYYVIS